MNVRIVVLIDHVLQILQGVNIHLWNVASQFDLSDVKVYRLGDLNNWGIFSCEVDFFAWALAESEKIFVSLHRQHAVSLIEAIRKLHFDGFVPLALDVQKTLLGLRVIFFDFEVHFLP